MMPYINLYDRYVDKYMNKYYPNYIWDYYFEYCCEGCLEVIYHYYESSLDDPKRFNEQPIAIIKKEGKMKIQLKELRDLYYNFSNN